MRKQAGYFGIFVVAVFAVQTTAHAGSPDEWAKVPELRGSISILLGRTGSDPGASTLAQTEMKRFIVQGTIAVKKVSTSADSILFKGTAKGLLFMQHTASVLGGQAAASEQLCSGEFNNGELLVEIFPREREYQVQFSGEVPACAVTTKYPAFQRMAEILGKWYAWHQRSEEPWEPLAAEMKSMRDEFASFSATEKKKAAVTFSAAAEPRIEKDPVSGFPTMHFYPLPESGARLQGTGKVQLTVSTSVMPTVVTTEAQWSLKAPP